MGTRSRIGIKLSDSSILSVYHHWDGYPEWLGVVLEREFNTRDKVTELIDGGDMSSCYCLLYTSPSPRDGCRSRMPSSA